MPHPYTYKILISKQLHFTLILVPRGYPWQNIAGEEIVTIAIKITYRLEAIKTEYPLEDI